MKATSIILLWYNPAQVKKVREEFAGRKEPWTWKEIENDFNKARQKK
jgi:hypothetical protein